jgi:tetratricopeptide (TPR) repeat protein
VSTLGRFGAALMTLVLACSVTGCAKSGSRRTPSNLGKMAPGRFSPRLLKQGRGYPRWMPNSTATGSPMTEARNPIGSPIMEAASSVADALTIKPKYTAAQDPTSLATKPGVIGPDLYVSAARIAERNGNVVAAREQYERALSIKSDDLSALLGLSRLCHKQSELDKAIQLCHRAIKSRPDSAIAHNDLGLCYLRQKQTDRAVEALGKAVQIRPASELYRNNLALALVLAGRKDEAFMHLTQVHAAAIAQYNLGYLLYKLDKPDEALPYFRQALELYPEMRQAAQMLQRLNSQARAATLLGRSPTSAAPAAVEVEPETAAVSRAETIAIHGSTSS